MLISAAHDRRVRGLQGTGMFPSGRSGAVPVLIIQSSKSLGFSWAGHLAQFELPIILVTDSAAGFDVIAGCRVTLVVIDIDADVGSAVALADYTAVRQPGVPVVFVTPGIPWTGPDLLIHAPNACGVFGRDTSPKDLATMIARHATAAVAI